METLKQAIETRGRIPLAWAGSTAEMSYLNLGDALSPVMVALVTGHEIERVPSNSLSARLAAVGTIAHGFEGGSVTFWGTGCSPWKNPGAPPGQRVRYTVPRDARLTIAATRGPLSADLLQAPPHGRVYGDPVWLLPRFYAPDVPKRWDLGVIVHLSELRDRAYEANVREEYRRYLIPDEMKGHVRLINTVTPVSVAAIRERLDDILACRRIVSTSLHGMVIAESYGIPCLYFAPGLPDRGLVDVELDPAGPLDPRIIDLYRGLGQTRLRAFSQARAAETDWADVIRMIDTAWQPQKLDEDALLAALPIDSAPLAPQPGKTVWDHPLVRDLVLRHDVARLAARDRKRTARFGVRAMAARVRSALGMIRRPSRQPGLLQSSGGRTRLAMTWVRTTGKQPHANLGDALSPLIAAAISGVHIRPTAFEQDCERLAAVGTIGHGLRNGCVHLWGTGFDATRNPVDRSLGRYTLPPRTGFRVHALRGRKTASLLRACGLDVPDVYGDPVWFLPRIFPMQEVRKTHELGVVLHISELTRPDPSSAALDIYKRYDVPEGLADKIRIINTYVPPTIAALEDKVREIVACRRILSTSFHGLVIAETYGIPCAWFGTYAGGVREFDANDESVHIDHRVRDFYSGTDRPALLAVCQDRSVETNWMEAIDALDQKYVPAQYDPSPLFAAFPVTPAVSLTDPIWPLPKGLQKSLRL
jgi:hypothetical protein